MAANSRSSSAVRWVRATNGPDFRSNSVLCERFKWAQNGRRRRPLQSVGRGKAFTLTNPLLLSLSQTLHLLAVSNYQAIAPGKRPNCPCFLPEALSEVECALLWPEYGFISGFGDLNVRAQWSHRSMDSLVSDKKEQI
ncbi:hypothetical protein KI387_015182 [Taxus chinensis]|uniref:Uncharacterized protein n=1 Tax=Taxus chinensis TaxID=29808 RepID=A0AA38GEX0_TAXCH|nr:hypothetical protein KI387_015182 [Taxus chinensis]